MAFSFQQRSSTCRSGLISSGRGRFVTFRFVSFWRPLFVWLSGASRSAPLRRCTVSFGMCTSSCSIVCFPLWLVVVLRLLGLLHFTPCTPLVRFVPVSFAAAILFEPFVIARTRSAIRYRYRSGLMPVRVACRCRSRTVSPHFPSRSQSASSRSCSGFRTASECRRRYWFR